MNSLDNLTICSNIKILLKPLLDDYESLFIESSNEQNKSVFFIKGSSRDVSKIVGNNAIVFKCLKTFISMAIQNSSVTLIVDVNSSDNCAIQLKN